MSALHPLQGSFCSVCGEALLSPAFADRPGALCGLCQRAHPRFERAVAYGSYDGELRALIHLLKYQQVRPAAEVLGRKLGDTIAALEKLLPEGTIQVVPVPLHRHKQAERGFNQAEQIARVALHQLGRPERFQLRPSVLVRQRETGSQIGLTRHQRRENLRGAFAAADPMPIAQSDVLLVDDVFTTGTTVSECARVLRRAGAARVWVVTVARTLKVADQFAMRNDSWDGENQVNAGRGAIADR